MTMQTTLQSRNENAQRPSLWFIPTEFEWEVGIDKINKYLKSHLPTAADENSHIFSILDDGNSLATLLCELVDDAECAAINISYMTNKTVNLITLSAFHEIIDLHVQEKQNTLNVSLFENASYACAFRPEDTRVPIISKRDNGEIEKSTAPFME